MEPFNIIILLLAIFFTVVVAIVNIVQVIVAYQGKDPLSDKSSFKIIYLILLIIFIAFLITHILTSILIDGAVGKDNLGVLLPGIFATVFAVISFIAFLFKNKMGNGGEILYFITLTLMWVCIIGHVVGRLLI